MSTESITETVKELMTGFAERTALFPSGRPPVRYLWTDAFAVCNFIELFCRTDDHQFEDCALRLIDQVHHSLGRHRQDDPRHGWISGFDEKRGEKHPTAGGLRIGKKFKERGAHEPFDQALEWERDGQYYHYLTKWMHALNLVFRITGDRRYLDWAVELAEAAHAGFVYLPSDGGWKRMFWKMSIDLSRPQVPAMGQHDPLDGLVSCLELQISATSLGMKPSDSLQKETDELADLCHDLQWSTDDPLGLGGLLCEAYRLAQLHLLTGQPVTAEFLPEILRDSLEGLSVYHASDALSYKAEHRLAFRELGLSIGLQAARNLHRLLADNLSAFDEGLGLHAVADRLLSFVALQEEINRFWLTPANQQVPSWQQHRDINAVMLATSLAPDCFLTVPTGSLPLSN